MKIDVKDHLRGMRTEAGMEGIDGKTPHELGRYIAGLDGAPHQLITFAAVMAEALNLRGRDHDAFAQGLEDVLREVAQDKVA